MSPNRRAIAIANANAIAIAIAIAIGVFIFGGRCAEKIGECMSLSQPTRKKSALGKSGRPEIEAYCATQLYGDHHAAPI